MSQSPSSTEPITWPLPSVRVQELMRLGAQRVLHAPPEWLVELDQASLASDQLVSDPVLAAAARRVNRSGLIHWAASNIERPGAPVPRYVSGDMLSNARELARRGEAELMYSAARASQNAAWQRWLSIVFELTSDPHELKELLAVSSRSISAYIDANMEGIAEFVKAEREERARGTHADRRDLVALIMEGVSVDPQHASIRLGYTLDQSHCAAIIWSEESEADLAKLEAAAEAFKRSADARDSLVIFPTPATTWVWVQPGRQIDLSTLEREMRRQPGIRMSIGSAGRGMDGFRSGHLDALTAQRLMGRLQSKANVVHSDDLRLVSLLTQHMESARRFIALTLGSLASADPTLRQSLYVFLKLGCNTAEAAQVLNTHRNTLLRRIDRAINLLPRPIDENRLHVGAALEALNWVAESCLPASYRSGLSP